MLIFLWHKYKKSSESTRTEVGKKCWDIGHIGMHLFGREKGRLVLHSSRGRMHWMIGDALKSMLIEEYGSSASTSRSKLEIFEDESKLKVQFGILVMVAIQTEIRGHIRERASFV